MKAYIQVEIFTDNVFVQEELMALLIAQNYEAFEQTDTQIYAYIHANNWDENALALVLNSLNLTYTFQALVTQNWNKVWESNYAPLVIDDKVGIRADFHPCFENMNYELVITPKMSFGTGHHPTTEMVVQLMLTLDFKEKTVFDFGTGTGVLAILSEKLGAKKITALEVEPWSVENSIENCKANHCNKIEIIEGDKAQVSKQYDIILANITKDILVENIDSITTLAHVNTQLIISGILEEDKETIENIAKPLGWKLTNSKTKKGWIALLLVKSLHIPI